MTLTDPAQQLQWDTRQRALGGSKHNMVDVAVPATAADALVKALPTVAVRCLSQFVEPAAPAVGTSVGRGARAGESVHTCVLVDHESLYTLTARVFVSKATAAATVDITGPVGAPGVRASELAEFASQLRAEATGPGMVEGGGSDASSKGGNAVKCYPQMSRHAKFDPYVPTSDELLVEYDFVETVFEADSKYQNIKIMKSRQFGNVLLLDDDPNLAESDLAYTHAITGHGREDYSGKDVLILGGGDGGILHELRGVARSIVMLEIDDVVMQAAARHLRGICHDTLDQYKGDNYEVIVCDCVPQLSEFHKLGRKFDFIINDLTAIPVSTNGATGDDWDFLRLILDMSLKVLKPTGVYYTQGNGANMTEALRMYEQQLSKLAHKVAFSKQTACVPSYHEMWVFYRLTMA